MAEITFGISDSNINIGGSGLGFYGTTFGSSVQIGSYQESTFVTNSDGTTEGPEANNVKYVSFASGDPALGSGVPLSKINSNVASLVINFDHSSAVNVQNAQLRIYDRSNINYPASGVNTKVAEIVNFDGKTYTSWDSTAGPSNVASSSNQHGSGDLFWWGSPWISTWTGQDYYTNSSGVRFDNYFSTEDGNGDSRLGGVSGDKETVGGTGIIVPLLNSPGSGQKFLNPEFNENIGGTRRQPKWRQYYNQSTRPDDVPDVGTGATDTYGGTGVDTRHTWRVALSASPVSIGSKTNFGLYFSLEYL